MRILLTRPLDQARATAARLARAGHEVLFAPMLTIEPLDPPAFACDDVAALAATSARVAAPLRARAEFGALRSRPVYPVGTRTGDALRAIGFSHVAGAAGDAAALARTLIDKRDEIDGTVLYPCGRERRGDLDARLREAGFDVRLVELYAAHKVDHLPDEVRAAFAAGRVDAVPIYSRRTGEAFARALERAGITPDGVRVLAISQAAGAPLAAAGHTVEVAATPDEAGLLALLEQ